MVTGQKPFDGRDAAEIKANILNAEPTPPNQISPKLHALVSEVILKSLAKDPGDRYQTGQELVNALERKKEETRAVAAPAVSRPAESSRCGSLLRWNFCLRSRMVQHHLPSKHAPWPLLPEQTELHRRKFP